VVAVAGGAGDVGRVAVGAEDAAEDIDGGEELERAVHGRPADLGDALAEVDREASLRVARRPDTALGQALEEGRELTGPFVTELAHDGDPVARDALETVGRALGVGLSSLVNLLNPEVIVIGGGVIAAGEMLLEPARRELRERALAPARDTVRVVPAAFGEEAGMIGAALMAREVAA